MFKLITLLLTASLSFLAVSCVKNNIDEPVVGSTTTTPAAKTTTYVTMPVNTAIAVTLTDSIDTDVQVSGADFRAKLNGGIAVDGKTLFADGAAARGTLNKIVESGHLKTPAELHFSLNAIQDGSGRWINVATNMIVEKKASQTNKDVALIGGGAIVGGIIGKIIDRDGSTEIGAATGAAAGTGVALATGKRDIFHGVGTEITFYSSQSTQIALR